MHEKDFDDLFRVEESLWWFRGMEAIANTMLSPYNDVIASGPMLDAGCGTGGFLASRSTRADDKFGFDCTKRGVQYCRRRGLEQTTVSDITAIPFPSSTFAFVSFLDVAAQLPTSDDVHRAFQECARVLRPGGILLFRSAALNWMRSHHDRALGSYRRLSRSEVRDYLARAGLRHEFSSYAMTLLFPAVFLRRKIIGAVFRGHGSDVQELPPALRWASRLFEAALRVEEAVIGRRISFPIGLSVVAIARKS